MKAVIVSSFDTYLERIELLKEYYENSGYETIVILSNFKHFKKEFVKEERNGFVYVDTKPYYKNLSIDRLYSHHKFAKDAFKIVDEIKPDLLHVLIPANSLAKEANNYKKTNSKAKLYLDLIDLWPETMPIGKLKGIFPFTLWKNIRDKNLNNANIVFTECNLYKNVLNKEHDDKFKTLYWAKKDDPVESHINLKANELHLCYLGSINNIIDIDLIATICKELNEIKHVSLHIIGNGEKKQELLEKVEETNVTIIDHGVIYDKKLKQDIFDQCHFGLNIMKPTVCVGLTMKSLDYFQGGLPIINSIKADTTELVKRYKVGYNDLSTLINDISTLDNLKLRRNVLKLYNDHFSKNVFFEKMKKMEEL